MKKRRTCKKLVGVALFLALVFMLGAACSSGQAQSSTTGGTPASGAAGAQRDYILIGIPNPTTGGLSGFGEGTAWIEELAIDKINGKGGIYIKELDKKLPIQIKVVDTESNPTKASEVASKLILEDKVDLMVVRHTPDTANPVAAICERYKVPCISLDAEVNAWLSGGPYKWTYHSFFTVQSAYEVFVNMWKTLGVQSAKVGFFFPNDPDGEAWSAEFAKRLPGDGYTVVDSGRFPQGTQDYTGIINQFKSEGVEVVVGNSISPDFATFWKQSAQMGFKPKIMTCAKAYLFESDALAVGADLINGLTTEVWWSPWHPYKSSIDGMTCKELTDLWTKENNRTWTPPLGFKYASMEIAADVLARAQSLDKEAIRQAIAATDLDTIVGHIKFNDRNYCETAVVGGQWVKTGTDTIALQIIENTQHPEIPTTGQAITLQK